MGHCQVTTGSYFGSSVPVRSASPLTAPPPTKPKSAGRSVGPKALRRALKFQIRSPASALTHSQATGRPATGDSRGKDERPGLRLGTGKFRFAAHTALPLSPNRPAGRGESSPRARGSKNCPLRRALSQPGHRPSHRCARRGQDGRSGLRLGAGAVRFAAYSSTPKPKSDSGSRLAGRAEGASAGAAGSKI
jgi:hypothetical protein